mgnify:CR=1 FL=1
MDGTDDLVETVAGQHFLCLVSALPAHSDLYSLEYAESVTVHGLYAVNLCLLALDVEDLRVVTLRVYDLLGSEQVTMVGKYNTPKALFLP